MNKPVDSSLLHVVNDAVTASNLQEAGVPGTVLVWQDALYEGPVTEFDDLDKLATIRARFFADRGYGAYRDIESAYRMRNAELKAFHRYDEVILWFDYDIFGQLQMAQVISWFNQRDTGRLMISLTPQEILRQGRVLPRLPQCTIPQLLELFAARTEITLAQSAIGEAAWRAFTAVTPTRLLSFYPADLSSMPFIKNAFARLVQEFPDKLTGLSRTAFLILDAVQNKQTTEDAIFHYVQRKEPVPFMSRNIFQRHFHALLQGAHPVLMKKVLKQESVLEVEGESDAPEENVLIHDYAIQFTRYTNQVLHQWADWVQLNGIDRWIGGVHLSEGVIWRYDKITRQVNRTYL